MARSYPDTPAGRSRRLRDADGAHMTRNGHQMTWRRWRKGILGQGNWLGSPGWEGRCRRCGDTVHVASLEGNVCYRSVTDAGGKQCSFRHCRGRRR
jgi:hypothetical protein